MHEIPGIFYDNDYFPITQNQSVTVDPLCNSVSFINLGTTVAFINGVLPLNPGTPGTNNGESFTFGGNLGELFRGRIDITFTGGAGFLLVIQKVYNRDTKTKIKI